MKYCNKPFERFYVLPDGRVRICQWTDGTVGNLINESVEEIWNGEKAERQRDAIRDGSFRFCRATSCPFLENDSLEDLSKEEFEEAIKSKDYPLHYNVALDYTCNHSCPSCRDKVFVGDDTYYSNVNLMINKLIPYLNKADEISTDGNGDAFASPAIMRMLQMIRPENKDCKIGIETNGVLFDEDHWDKIKHLSDYYMYTIVTPNSFDESTFMYLNGGHNTYNKLMQSLEFISNLRQEGKLNRFTISIVVQDKNYKELPEFVRRCIEEFKVDRVSVKPIYRWFALNEEDYWFKDILNPLHPYHKDYMQVLKSDILKHEKVFLWGGDNIHPAAKHPAYHYKEQLDFLVKCLSDKKSKERLASFCEDNKIKGLYIYGDEDLSGICGDLLAPYVDIKGYAARDICRDEINGSKIIPLCDFMPNKDDTVLIIKHQFIDLIRRDMEVNGVNCRMIGLDKLMEACM